MFLSGFGHNSAIPDEPNEAMPYRLTILGLIGGISLLVYLNHLMGMSFGFALLFVLFLSGVFIALTWQIINGGIPFINPSFSPQSFFPHDTWVVTNDSLDNNMAFHAPHLLDLAPERVYDAQCYERFEGCR